MGSCCKASIKDNDIENIQNIYQLEKIQKGKNFSSIDFQTLSKYNTGIDNKLNIDSNNVNNNEQVQKKEQEQKLYISEKKLKLTVLQSKCLLEGKEYLINSLGIIDSNKKNIYKDGLVIFGDINVSKTKIQIYKNIFTLTNFLKEKQEFLYWKNMDF